MPNRQHVLSHDQVKADRYFHKRGNLAPPARGSKCEGGAGNGRDRRRGDREASEENARDDRRRKKNATGFLARRRDGRSGGLLLLSEPGGSPGPPPADGCRPAPSRGGGPGVVEDELVFLRRLQRHRLGDVARPGKTLRSGRILFDGRTRRGIEEIPEQAGLEGGL